MEKKKVLTILGMMVVIIILGVAVVPKQQVAKAFSGWCPPAPVPVCGAMMPPCSNNLCTTTDVLHFAPFCVGGVCMYATTNCCNGCNGPCNGCVAPTCNNGNCCTLADCPTGDSGCTCAALGGTNCGFAGTCAVGGALSHTNSGTWTCCNGACAVACGPADGNCPAGCTNPPDPDCIAIACGPADGNCPAGCTNPPDPDCAAIACGPADGNCPAGCTNPPDPDCAVAGALTINITNPIKTSDFSKLVENFLLWILSVGGALALFMLVAGGVFYVTSSGNEQRIETARKMITWTILGLMLILASFSIIVVLDKILT